ncbi:IS21 family transposase [Adlercreutzia sp. ZJ242]|uniref:IS21 family transposase n=1 Tax=Adlercreutzia sp. ZJ242 TaxID=2709409 RepID=UPI0013EDB3A9|nr:IS21 family transposase [Adlercreutzia sp. ZJ242]
MEPKVSYKEIVRLTFSGGYSQREIAAAAGCSSGTVCNVQRKLRLVGLDGPTVEGMSEKELRGLLSEQRGRKPDANYVQPDHAAIQEQLDKHKGLTLAIAWEEYAANCVAANKTPYMYSFFVQKHREWQNASDLSLRIPHVPGDRMEVDWAGTAMEWVDMYTGEVHEVYLFVATLPYSQYTFVKPAESVAMDDWIGCNVAALHFFGGSPRIVVPDNLRTGVAAHTSDEVVINRTYREFGEHYGLAVVPTGIRKPKHKPSVEGNVGKIGERIALMLRNQRFFSMAELEDAVASKLTDLNSRPFKKRADGSRKEVFLAKEKQMLSPLPATDFEPGRWLSRTVSPDYRVSVDASTYTVPYTFAGQLVDVRVGRLTVEVFCDGERIATHPRSHKRNDDVKQESHQPKWHTELLQQSGERFRQRALDEIGPWGRKVADAMLSAGRAEEEGYRPCAKLLNLASTHGGRMVEEACERACGITRTPSLKTVKVLLANMPDRDEQRDAKEDYAILRAEGYYGKDGEANDDGIGGIA